MTPEELNIACAKARGWIRMPDGPDWLPKNSMKSQSIPNIISDANAQRDAFLELSEEQKETFVCLLHQKCRHEFLDVYTGQIQFIKTFFTHFAEIYLKTVAPEKWKD